MVQVVQKKIIGSLAISEKNSVFWLSKPLCFGTSKHIFLYIYCIQVTDGSQLYSMAHSFSCNLQIYRKNSTINFSGLGCPVSGLSYKYKLSLFSVHYNLKFGAPVIDYYISMQAVLVSELSRQE